MATPHPLAGPWTVNIGKSRRHPNHQFQSSSMHFTIDGNAVVLAFAGVNASGTHESARLTMNADAIEHPIPQAPGVVSLCQWVGTHALETIGKKDGAIVGHGTYAVSDDGLVMTATVKGTDAQGSAFEQAIVFDRGAGDY